MEEGFILSNKFRKIIFDDLASGERDVRVISKKNHIPIKVVEEIVREMADARLVEIREGMCYLTREGERLAERLKRR
ncbi:MAG TPA: hypothetical protein ENG60_01525 [Thermoplasmatales archaeon]|nr:hypothetical protein [Thermoplasmatales archaeon]HEX17083.1 hypothetical protein [Thermoplasmatales archaeon]